MAGRMGDALSSAVGAGEAREARLKADLNLLKRTTLRLKVGWLCALCVLWVLWRQP